jgi:hypothetical protein
MIDNLNNKQEHFENNKQIKGIKQMIKDQKKTAVKQDSELQDLINKMNPDQKKVFKFYQKKLSEARKDLDVQKLMQVQSDFMKAMQKTSHVNTNTK